MLDEGGIRLAASDDKIAPFSTDKIKSCCLTTLREPNLQLQIQKIGIDFFCNRFRSIQSDNVLSERISSRS